MSSRPVSIAEHLLRTIQQLERLELEKQAANERLKDGFANARETGFDPATLRVVLRLRRMTPGQRKEKRALEAIYLAALGMLEGDPLPDEARRRLDGQDDRKPSRPSRAPEPPSSTSPAPPEQQSPATAPPPQASLPLKDPEEARQEGGAAAGAGKRIYDNPYPAGDPCRAAWDEGWCEKKKSHGMDLPAAYQRRTTKPPKDAADKDGATGAPGGDAGDEKDAA